MKSTPITMTGTATFNTFSYLLNGAASLLQTAKVHPQGSAHVLVSSALFCAFTVEAHLNHIGEAKLPFWKIVEPKLSWGMKLELIAQHLGIELEYGKRPLQTVGELFKFRDRLAHGKTTTQEVSYECRAGLEDEFSALDPDWLKKFWSEEAVERALADVTQLLKLFHEKAGFDSLTLYGISTGAFWEQAANDTSAPNPTHRADPA